MIKRRRMRRQTLSGASVRQTETSGVIRAQKIQTAGIGRYSASATIAASQQIGYPPRVSLTAADKQQGTDNVAHHVLKEGVGAHSHRDQPLINSPHSDRVDVADGAARLTAGCAKAAEIMFTQQKLRRAVHGITIQISANPEQQASVQGRRLRAVEDTVHIMAPLRAETGMEVIADRTHPPHRHILRQMAVAAALPRQNVAFSAAVKMNDLLAGMRAGVGASGAAHPDRMVRHPAEGPLNTVLHVAGMRLRLPAAKAGSIVFKG